MKLNLTITALNNANFGATPAVAVGLQITAEGQPMGAPQPPAVTIYVSKQAGDELELGETFSVEVKPDTP